MVEKNCSLPFSFYCLTEDKSQKWGYPLDLDLDLESYRWKIQLFNLPWESPTLYFDLDIVIQNNIDSLLQRIEKNKILTINPDLAGINRLQDAMFLPFEAKINSSVLGIHPVTVSLVYERFIAAKDYNIVKYYGLDRYISDNHLSLCKYLEFDNDFYFRWKGYKTPSMYCKDTMVDGKLLYLAHDPRKTICIISQEHNDMYQGLEKYFL